MVLDIVMFVQEDRLLARNNRHFLSHNRTDVIIQNVWGSSDGLLYQAHVKRVKFGPVGSPEPKSFHLVSIQICE